ncbi:hypothetical protein HPP92_009198 [Vanilla planifolia]|uniref:Uncharacterized protein n=1 Tax=Vanilla planifolia TaxID=51239 RepID=A0A835R644_VANPL|nr:hypothetical protein HPP92_009198 [Vanilla planifolia]
MAVTSSAGKRRILRVLLVLIWRDNPLRHAQFDFGQLYQTEINLDINKITSSPAQARTHIILRSHWLSSQMPFCGFNYVSACRILFLSHVPQSVFTRLVRLHAFDVPKKPTTRSASFGRHGHGEMMAYLKAGMLLCATLRKLQLLWVLQDLGTCSYFLEATGLMGKFLLLSMSNL